MTDASTSDGRARSAEPTADNDELPDRVPDPAIDDLEVGEQTTDATVEDALKAADQRSDPHHVD